MAIGVPRAGGVPAVRGSGRLRLGVALTLALTTVAPAAQPVAGSADALRTIWTRAADSDAQTMAGTSLAIVSAQSAGALSGSLVGTLERRFAEVAAVFTDPGAWCAVLILDPNVHRCRVRAAPDSPATAHLELAFGPSASPLVLAFAPAATADYLRVRLTAGEGPFGTRDYAMALEAAPLDDGRCVVQLAFAQHFGLAARLAMLAYFHTAGRGKVGFTVVTRDASGRAVRVDDMRGGVERNLVRQWLALVAYLDTRGVATPDLARRRVGAWLAGTERFPLQLREEEGYLARKVPEVRRQLAADP